MSTEKKKDLIAMLEAGLKLKHVFKATMLVFFPDETYWETRNADAFFKQSTDIISATVEFVNDHTKPQSFPAHTERFTERLARAAITQKCSEIKKKLRKLSK